MGRLLEALRVESGPAATPATPATFQDETGQESQSRRSRNSNDCENAQSDAPRVAESQESQGVRLNTAAIRERLLDHAQAIRIDPALIRALSEPDLAAYSTVPDDLLPEYVGLMLATADRHAGRVPAGDTAAMQCERCGPVWTHPAVAAVLPVVDGWPRAVGCPWCFVRKAGGYIPRPRVTCEGCHHFTPDAINAPTGMGVCANGCGMPYPMQRHSCAQFQPNTEPTR